MKLERKLRVEHLFADEQLAIGRWRIGVVVHVLDVVGQKFGPRLRRREVGRRRRK